MSSFIIRFAESSETGLWDAYVDNHAQGSPYHKSAWVNAVFSSYHFAQYSIIAWDDAAEKIVGVFPLIMMKVPFKGHSLCALPYCDIGGPLANNQEITEALSEFSINFAKENGISSLQVRATDEVSNNSAETSNEQLEGCKVRMLLGLPSGSEALMASFKSKLRSQIRKAEKNGLTFKTGNNTVLLNDFYHVYCVNMRDLGSPAHHKSWFESIAKYYDNSAIISVVYKDDIPVGGGVVLLNRTVASIPWASTIQAYNRLAPNMLLYWSVLSACADKDVATFDFGRSTFNEGTYKFKKQWGAQPIKLVWQDYFNLTPEPSTDSPSSASSSSNSALREWVENIWRKLPLSVTVFLGGKVRKYISL